VHSLNHRRVSLSIQVMAKGIIKQAGIHILDLDQESGEFLCYDKLSLAWEVRQLWQTSGCFYINAGMHISTSSKIWEEFKLSFLCLYLGFA